MSRSRTNGVRSEFTHDGLKGAFVVLEQDRQLTVLVLESLVLEYERHVESFEFGFKFLCAVERTSSV
jgi:hypothetical protein